jgi:hypothetical protein
MFTGIIQATGTLARIEPLGGDLRLTFDVRELASRIEARRLALGESIAVSGACLTVIAFDGQRFSADVSRETLRLTTLGRMTEGAEVNLEAALRAGDPLVSRPQGLGGAGWRQPDGQQRRRAAFFGQPHSPYRGSDCPALPRAGAVAEPGGGPAGAVCGARTATLAPMSSGPRLVESAAPVFDRIEDILADLAAGKMVVVVDDEDRENEGDLLMAAQCVRPEDINFMARFGRGLICLTLTRERCQQLRLPLMVSDTDREQRTNFTRFDRGGRGRHHGHLGL